jgi:hypothetical protein
MRNKFFAFLLAILMLSIAADALFAADAFKYGVNFRLRQEYWQDVTDLNKDLNKDENFFRLKTSLWGKYDFSENVNAFLKLTNEARYYMLSNSVESATVARAFDGDEGVVDNLYVEIKNLYDKKLDLKIGRQDFLGTFGEGFLIMDGTPGDGSRTFYFNAIKATLRLSEKNSLDIVMLYDDAKDKMLLFNNGKVDKAVNATDESGLILYDRMKLSDNINLEPYIINKREIAATTLNLNTLGARIVDTCAPWKFRGELAIQSGEYDNAAKTKRSGVGGYAFATRNFNEAKYKPELEAGIVYLSGDDQTTADVEGFDPLFSRWPWLSELYILTLAKETGIAGYWTNLMWIRIPQVKLQCTDKTSFIASYNLLSAPQKQAGSILSNDGTNKGQLIEAMVKHIYNANISGYLLVEYFMPGNFYNTTIAPGPATFIRWNIDVKF